MKNSWISLLGNINPVKVGKMLMILCIFAFSISANAQAAPKPVMIDAIEGNQIVKKAATLQQVVAKMTKTSYTYDFNGKSNPVYTTGKTYYAIIEITSGVAKRRLNIAQ
jgi:predicted alternative tryptophan synthase beta-subunit